MFSAYEKHYPPFADDEVWRLEKIGKGGPTQERLNYYKITTIGDFKRMYSNNLSLGVESAKNKIKKKKLQIKHLTIMSLLKNIGFRNHAAVCEFREKLHRLFDSIEILFL